MRDKSLPMRLEIASNPSNKIKVIAGTIGTKPQEIKNGDEKKPLDARLNNPVSVDVDKSGNIFIVDKGNNAIRVLTKKGISTIQISVSKDDEINDIKLNKNK